MATTSGSYQVHTEARGPHWIAWVSRDGSGKPERSVVLVAETRESGPNSHLIRRRCALADS
jgi:hypothetical protein